MTDAQFLLDRLRRMTVIEWTHGILGCGALAAGLLIALTMTP